MSMQKLWPKDDWEQQQRLADQSTAIKPKEYQLVMRRLKVDATLLVVFLAAFILLLASSCVPEYVLGLPRPQPTVLRGHGGSFPLLPVLYDLLHRRVHVTYTIHADPHISFFSSSLADLRADAVVNLLDGLPVAGMALLAPLWVPPLAQKLRLTLPRTTANFRATGKLIVVCAPVGLVFEGAILLHHAVSFWWFGGVVDWLWPESYSDLHFNVTDIFVLLVPRLFAFFALVALAIDVLCCAKRTRKPADGSAQGSL